LAYTVTVSKCGPNQLPRMAYTVTVTMLHLQTQTDEFSSKCRRYLLRNEIKLSALPKYMYNISNYYQLNRPTAPQSRFYS